MVTVKIVVVGLCAERGRHDASRALRYSSISLESFKETPIGWMAFSLLTARCSLLENSLLAARGGLEDLVITRSLVVGFEPLRVDEIELVAGLVRVRVRAGLAAVRPRDWKTKACA